MNRHKVKLKHKKGFSIVIKFFKINEKQSQIDWCIVNEYSLYSIESFKIVRDSPTMSDHKLITIAVEISGEKSLDYLVKGAIDLNRTSTNHSRVPTINKQNTNLSCLTIC